MGKRLSIIIPVYNCPCVGQAIESIPKSDFIEMIVVDGESNRETQNVLERYKDRMDVFISEKDRGLYDAMNKGIQESTGDWVLTLAADDQLVCSPITIIDKYANHDVDLICGRLIAKDLKDRFFVIEPDRQLNRLDIECSIAHPGVFFKRAAYGKYGRYDIRYRCAADHELFLRFFRYGAKFGIIDEVVTYFQYGGMSTLKPSMAFKEDVQISDRYGVPFIRTRAYFMERYIKLYGARLKDKFDIPHKTHYMDLKEMEIFLDNHPEIIKRDFL